MTTTINLAEPDVGNTRNELRRRSGWPDKVSYAAAAWAAIYGVAALIWTITDSGFPFGTNDPGNDTALLRNLSPSVGAPVFAAVFLTTAVLMWAMSDLSAARPARWMRVLAIGSGWTVGVALLIVVPDTRVLTILGYAPLLLIGGPLGLLPDDIDYSEIFTWALFNQFFAVIGGFLIVVATLAWQRRTASACGYCGRRAGGDTWTTPESAARWGRWAVAVAAVVPALYAISRISWALNIPFGVDDEFLRDLRAEDADIAAAGLGGFALVGAVLTLGLVQRWGEVFPRWLVGLRGKRVPVKLAVIPAAIVAAAVASASASLLSMPNVQEVIVDGDWAVVPMLFWPLWSVALGVATLAYHLRRRGRCSSCGRG
jgi:hypothetical protein